MSNTTNDPHVYAEIESIMQHDVVAGPARYWTTTQQTIVPRGFWTLTSFETWVTL